MPNQREHNRSCRGTLFLGLLLAVAVLVGTPPGFPRSHAGAHSAAQATEKKEVTVWVNTRSGVYHCPGSRWYGKSKKGNYMGECAARKAGYRPAYKKPCGSTCP